MMIDFHSHILPGIDDGSGSVEESIRMLRAEAEQGISKVIATPHFYAHHDSPERFLERRKEAEERLREAMERYENMPEIEIGAEVYYFSGISESDVLKLLTIGQKRCILLEMPVSSWTPQMYKEIEAIQVKQGITPIIAHMDRYIAPFRTRGIPERLAELPVAVQVNASFFLRRSTASMAIRMLRRDQIHLLGSDCHNMDMRPPNLGPALQVIRRRLGDEAIDRILRNGESVLENS